MKFTIRQAGTFYEEVFFDFNAKTIRFWMADVNLPDHGLYPLLKQYHSIVSKTRVLIMSIAMEGRTLEAHKQ